MPQCDLHGKDSREGRGGSGQVTRGFFSRTREDGQTPVRWKIYVPLAGTSGADRLEWNEGADIPVTLSAITWGGPGEAASLPGTFCPEDKLENDESMK